ncbi:MAG TPA: glycosyltransferase [Methylomirabilota bacterium]|nr:glycosyltransferase [Methylomirabilota bacterium]
MKLLTYTSLFPNHTDPTHGVFVYQRLVHFAGRAGNSVHVIAPVPWAPPVASPARYRPLRSIPAREEIGGLEVWHPRYPLMPGASMPLHGLLMFLGSLRRARRLHARERFEAIDAHYVYPDGFAAVLTGKALGLPVVVSARGTDMNLFPRFRTIRPLIRWTLRNAAGGIGVCTPLRDAMIACSLDRDRAAVIGNGVDLSRFDGVSRAEARARLGIDAGAKVCLAVGALIPRKGFHLLIPAIAEVAREVPGCVLYIVGEGSQRTELAQLARDLHVESRVRLVGAVPNEELRWWYSAADISCLVSSREGWPNVLLESLACGTPVVATSIWGVPEVITSPGLGILVEQTIPAITVGVRAALATAWSRDALIAHARSRTWGVVAEELESFLERRLAAVGR